jgi:lysophospholipase L1-like esterase
MKTVLLLGDSIRLSFQPLVRDMLAGRAKVVGPSDNCRFALYMLMRLDHWLQECGAPDVIHWNVGFWDLGQCRHRRPVQTALEDYVGNLGFVLGQLRKTGAAIVWAATTPVRGDRGWRDDWLFLPEDVDRYNRAARDLMWSEGVPCHELGAVVLENQPAFLGEDGVHLNADGQQACARAVVRTLEPYLGT